MFNIESIQRPLHLHIWQQRMMSGLYHKWKVIRLVENSGNIYDWVIVCRCDYTYPNVITFDHEFPRMNTLYIPTPDIGNPVYITNRTPDHLYAGSLLTMKIVTNIYNEIEKYINDIPEDGLYKYIMSRGLLMSEFWWGGNVDPARGGWETTFYD